MVPRRPHRALYIGEIIDEIFSKLAEGNDDDESEETVEEWESGTKRGGRDTVSILSAALCCKRFVSPGLDNLWKHMETLIPLLLLLPGTVQLDGVVYVMATGHLLILPRRAREYAKRIVDLTYTIQGDFRAVHPSSWMRLLPLGKNLLPQLKSFRLVYDSATAIGVERSLLLLPTILPSRPIVSIAVDTLTVIFNNNDGLYPASSILSEVNPGITGLSLSVPIWGEYTDCLLGIRTLRSVDLVIFSAGPTSRFLTLLNDLPNLTDLTLDFVELDGITFTGSVITYPFSNLTKLTLDGISQLEHIFPLIKAPKLQYIKIDYSPDRFPSCTPTREHLLLAGHPNLTSIIVDWGAYPQNRAGKSSITNFTWNVRRLSQIETFVLTSLDPNICFTGAEVMAIAGAWPGLRVLRVEHIRKPAHEPTLASLGYLASKCPRLIEIAITVKEGFPRTDGTDPVSFHRLEKLDLQYTDITDHARMARYLDGLFPDICTFSSLSEGECAIVRAIIFNVCQPVRKDQQRREKIRSSRFEKHTGCCTLYSNSSNNC